MTTEKFQHLRDIDTKSENIKRFLVDQIYEGHYPQVKAHFEWIKAISSNKEVISAANDILAKIENIMTLWQTKFSWEIMAATSDGYKNIFTKSPVFKSRERADDYDLEATG